MSNEQFIELEELCGIIHASNSRTVTKWCMDHKMPILTIGSKRMTYRFLVQVELDSQLIQVLKDKSPKDWESLYQCYLNRDPQGFLSFLNENNIENEKEYIKLRVKPVSDYAKKFANL